MPTAVDPLPLQGSLFAVGLPAVHADTPVERMQLDDQSWVDIARGWLSGGDELFASLVASLAWEEHQRPMYDRVVAVPRLTAVRPLTDDDLPPVLVEGGRLLDQRYQRRFDRLGFNLYRNGSDSVAWHGDRIGRELRRPVVAILTLGGARPFALRPKGGGRSRRIVPSCGDLLVLGGAIQRQWEHAVPKVARADPRLSVMFRYGPDGRIPAGATEITTRASSGSSR